MIATSTLLLHWAQYNYAAPGHVWYESADWPNVFVVLPLVVLGYLITRSRHITVVEAHKSLARAHVEHAEKLDKLLDKLDPESQGGISDVLDRLDIQTPGGIADLHAEIVALKPNKEK